MHVHACTSRTGPPVTRRPGPGPGAPAAAAPRRRYRGPGPGAGAPHAARARPSTGRAHPRLGRVLAQHGVQAAAVQREQLRQQRHVAAHRGRLLLLALAQVAVQALRARP